VVAFPSTCDVTLISEVSSRARLLLARPVRRAFPNVFSEAMACGVPCVTTETWSAIRRGLVGRTGQVVPARDPAALAAALAFVDRHRGRKDGVDWASRTRSAVLQEFSLSRASAAYEALYARSFSDSYWSLLATGIGRVMLTCLARSASQASQEYPPVEDAMSESAQTTPSRYPG